MKKLFTLLACFLSLGFFSTATFAVTAEGTIDEVRICGTGLGGTDWRNAILFKLSTDQWFFSYANHSSGSNDYDSNFTYSHIMSAHSSRFKVKVNATENASDATSVFDCGVTPVAGLFNNNGDYISIIEFSE